MWPVLVLLLAAHAPTPADDVALVERTFRALHPGLERYSGVDLARSVVALRTELAGTSEPRRVILALMRFTASLRCSHTYVNPLNQSKTVQSELLDRRDRLPLAFRVTQDDRFVVTGNASPDSRLLPGTEVLALDGRPADGILRELWPLARGDGHNDAKRRDDLSVKGTGGYETYDVAYALRYAPGGDYRVRARSVDGQVFEVSVPATTRTERAERLRAGRPAEPPWSQRRLADGTMVLRLSTFSTWTFDFDWKAWLGAAFAAAREKAVPRLVVDVRGNEGGDDAVVEELFGHLFTLPRTVDAPRALVRYQRLDPELGGHLASWSDDFRELKDVRPLGNGWFERRAGGTTTLLHGADAFRGPVVLLVDAANSSATFRLADVLSRTGRARLAGQPTGGNRRGTNGGLVAFFTLPASGFEIDLPLVGYFPATDEKDEGIAPDVTLTPGADDTELLASLD